MNSFCLYCTGGKHKEVKECEDHYCPFYMFRKANLEWQENKKGENYESNKR